MDQFKDFYKVKDLKFDIVKLREALKQVISKKKQVLVNFRQERNLKMNL